MTIRSASDTVSIIRTTSVNSDGSKTQKRGASHTSSYLKVLSEILTLAEENAALVGSQEVTLLLLLQAYDVVLRRHRLSAKQDQFYYRILLKLSLDPEPDWWTKLQRECRQNDPKRPRTIERSRVSRSGGSMIKTRSPLQDSASFDSGFTPREHLGISDAATTTTKKNVKIPTITTTTATATTQLPADILELLSRLDDHDLAEEDKGILAEMTATVPENTSLRRRCPREEGATLPEWRKTVAAVETELEFTRAERGEELGRGGGGGNGYDYENAGKHNRGDGEVVVSGGGAGMLRGRYQCHHVGDRGSDSGGVGGVRGRLGELPGDFRTWARSARGYSGAQLDMVCEVVRREKAMGLYKWRTQQRMLAHWCYVIKMPLLFADEWFTGWSLRTRFKWWRKRVRVRVWSTALSARHCHLTTQAKCIRGWRAALERSLGKARSLCAAVLLRGNVLQRKALVRWTEFCLACSVALAESQRTLQAFILTRLLQCWAQLPPRTAHLRACFHQILNQRKAGVLIAWINWTQQQCELQMKETSLRELRQRCSKRRALKGWLAETQLVLHLSSRYETCLVRLRRLRVWSCFHAWSRDAARAPALARKHLSGQRRRVRGRCLQCWRHWAWTQRELRDRQHQVVMKVSSLRVSEAYSQWRVAHSLSSRLEECMDKFASKRLVVTFREWRRHAHHTAAAAATGAKVEALHILRVLWGALKCWRGRARDWRRKKDMRGQAVQLLEDTGRRKGLAAWKSYIHRCGLKESAREEACGHRTKSLCRRSVWSWRSYIKSRVFKSHSLRIAFDFRWRRCLHMSLCRWRGACKVTKEVQEKTSLALRSMGTFWQRRVCHRWRALASDSRRKDEKVWIVRSRFDRNWCLRSFSAWRGIIPHLRRVAGSAFAVQAKRGRRLIEKSIASWQSYMESRFKKRLKFSELDRYFHSRVTLHLYQTWCLWLRLQRGKRDMLALACDHWTRLHSSRVLAAWATYHLAVVSARRHRQRSLAAAAFTGWEWVASTSPGWVAFARFWLPRVLTSWQDIARWTRLSRQQCTALQEVRSCRTRLGVLCEWRILVQAQLQHRSLVEDKARWRLLTWLRGWRQVSDLMGKARPGRLRYTSRLMSTAWAALLENMKLSHSDYEKAEENRNLRLYTAVMEWWCEWLEKRRLHQNLEREFKLRLLWAPELREYCTLTILRWRALLQARSYDLWRSTVRAEVRERFLEANAEFIYHRRLRTLAFYSMQWVATWKTRKRVCSRQYSQGLVLKSFQVLLDYTFRKKALRVLEWRLMQYLTFSRSRAALRAWRLVIKLSRQLDASVRDLRVRCLSGWVFDLWERWRSLPIWRRKREHFWSSWDRFVLTRLLLAWQEGYRIRYGYKVKVTTFLASIQKCRKFQVFAVLKGEAQWRKLERVLTQRAIVFARRRGMEGVLEVLKWYAVRSVGLRNLAWGILRCRQRAALKMWRFHVALAVGHRMRRGAVEGLWVGRLLGGIWTAWRCFSRNQDLKRLAGEHFAERVLGRCFREFRAFLESQREVRAKAYAALRLQWYGMQAWIGYMGWTHCKTHSLNVAQHHDAKAHLSLGLQAWIQAIAAKKSLQRKQHLVEKAVNRHLRSRVFFCWRVVFGAIQHHRSHTLAAVLSSWHQLTLYHSKLDQSYRLCYFSWRNRLLLEFLASWHHCAARRVLVRCQVEVGIDRWQTRQLAQCYESWRHSAMLYSAQMRKQHAMRTALRKGDEVLERKRLSLMAVSYSGWLHFSRSQALAKRFARQHMTKSTCIKLKAWAEYTSAVRWCNQSRRARLFIFWRRSVSKKLRNKEVARKYFVVCYSGRSIASWREFVSLSLKRRNRLLRCFVSASEVLDRSRANQAWGTWRQYLCFREWKRKLDQRAATHFRVRVLIKSLLSWSSFTLASRQFQSPVMSPNALMDATSSPEEHDKPPSPETVIRSNNRYMERLNTSREGENLRVRRLEFHPRQCDHTQEFTVQLQSDLKSQKTRRQKGSSGVSSLVFSDSAPKGQNSRLDSASEFQQHDTVQNTGLSHVRSCSEDVRLKVSRHSICNELSNCVHETRDANPTIPVEVHIDRLAQRSGTRKETEIHTGKWTASPSSVQSSSNRNVESPNNSVDIDRTSYLKRIYTLNATGPHLLNGESANIHHGNDEYHCREECPRITTSSAVIYSSTVSCEEEEEENSSVTCRMSRESSFEWPSGEKEEVTEASPSTSLASCSTRGGPKSKSKLAQRYMDKLYKFQGRCDLAHHPGLRRQDTRNSVACATNVSCSSRDLSYQIHPREVTSSSDLSNGHHSAIPEDPEITGSRDACQYPVLSKKVRFRLAEAFSGEEPKEDNGTDNLQSKLICSDEARQSWKEEIRTIGTRSLHSNLSFPRLKESCLVDRMKNLAGKKPGFSSSPLDGNKCSSRRHVLQPYLSRMDANRSLGVDL